MANALAVKTSATAIGLVVGSVDELQLVAFSLEGSLSERHQKIKALVGENPQEVCAPMVKRFTPTKEIEPDHKGPVSKAIMEALKPIGAKIQPNMSQEQVSVWLLSMVMALGDLPPDVALLAIKSTLHRPMQFIGQVETQIRKEASWPIRKMNLAADTVQYACGYRIGHIPNAISEGE